MPYLDGKRTAITEFFGDLEYTFDIVDEGWKMLTELERAVGSILPFFNRLRAGNFLVNELREVIRLSLIGGGQSPRDAARLVETYFDMNPVTESLHIAMAVSGAALFGTSEDGKVLTGEEDANVGE
ncbi:MULTISPECIES: gene transfer agent family protein [Rhizobium]|uniref:gene transfer agent family protein n=1 Tax=Rhizobium TaxID=379 RepID=UPI001884BA3C|nr:MULTISPECIES: gene transfer agent family protein [Rhizobium]